MLASVILPRPESDLKTELNFPVSDSNTAFSQISLLPERFNAKTSWRNGDCKAAKAILQGQNPPEAAAVITAF
jgi:hypothetical protein